MVPVGSMEALDDLPHSFIFPEKYCKFTVSTLQDVYELYHNGSQTVGERVLSHEVGDDCITNMVAWPGAITAATTVKTAPIITLAIGQEEKCVIMKLKPNLRTVRKEEVTVQQSSKGKDKGYLIFVLFEACG